MGRVTLDLRLKRSEPPLEERAPPQLASSSSSTRERSGKERKLKPSELKALQARRAVVKPLLDYGDV